VPDDPEVGPLGMDGADTISWAGAGREQHKKAQILKMRMKPVQKNNDCERNRRVIALLSPPN
jgi:hypothetical protein